MDYLQTTQKPAGQQCSQPSQFKGMYTQPTSAGLVDMGPVDTLLMSATGQSERETQVTDHWPYMQAAYATALQAYS